MSGRIIEEDRGSTDPRPAHPHNGYYAGDFTGLPVDLASWFDWGRRESNPHPGAVPHINL
jgi:hypothetical protein